MPPTTFSQIKNNVATLLNTGCAAGDVNIQLVAGAGALFPAAPFYCSVEFEVMRCTAKAVDTLTVTRGVDGTTAVAHAGGTVVEMRGNAALWTEVQAAVNAVENGTNPVPFNPPAGSITSNMIADGTIVNADVAPAAAIAKTKLAGYPFSNADLASDVARANLLTNGGFEIWQRGAITATAQSAFAADRWYIGTLVAGDAISLSKDTANTDASSLYCLAIVYTRGATGGTQIEQYMTIASDNTQLAGRTLTLSMRVKTPTANAIRLYCRDGLGGVTYSPYHPGVAGVYQTLSLTFTVPTTTTGFRIGLDLQQSCGAFADNAMLVIGSVAADYVPLHPADDLARCLRYYRFYGGSVNSPGLRGNAGIVGDSVGIVFNFDIPTAVVPTVTKNGTWTMANSPAQPSIGAKLDTHGFVVTMTSTAAGFVTASPDSVDDTITVEANP